MPPVLCRHRLRDRRAHGLPRVSPAGVESQVDHGVRATLREMAFGGGGDGQPVEKGRVALDPPLHGRLEVALQRAQHERLAEAPRAAEQRGAAAVDEVGDRRGLVHVDEALHHVGEALDPDGHAPDAQPVHDARITVPHDRPVAHARPQPLSPAVPAPILPCAHTRP